MTTETLIPLQTITLGGAASSINFGSIPNTYRDLCFVINASLSSSAYILYRINGDGSQNYTQFGFRALSGNNVSGFSNSYLWGYTSQNAVDANTMLSAKIDLLNYSQSNVQKTLLNNSNGIVSGDSAVFRDAQLWSSTSVISSINFFTNTGNMNAGTTISLYGIHG